MRRNAAIWTAAVVSTALVTGLGTAGEASAAPKTLVVAPNGDDSAPGTLARPLKTIQKAVNLAAPGDVIAVRGGTYALTDNITIATSGTASQPIALSAYQGERVVVDGEQLPASHTPVGGSIPRAQRGAIHQEASYWHISGLEIVNGRPDSSSRAPPATTRSSTTQALKRRACTTGITGCDAASASSPAPAHLLRWWGRGR